jgi:hypothetical protein
MLSKRITIVRENLGLDDRSTYGRNLSWYGITHMLKVWDVLFDIQYNTSTIVRGGKTMNVPSVNRECSWFGQLKKIQKIIISYLGPNYPLIIIWGITCHFL